MSDLITHGLKVAFFGHDGQELEKTLGLDSSELEEADVAIFLVSAKDGIVRADSDTWLLARELYIPSIVVITDLSQNNETDFEDMTLIAGKILDPVVTPYLVLHADDGSPIALIDLQNQKISDYSSGEMHEQESDRELQELIREFRNEYIESVNEAGEGAFENGLLFPAIPWIQENSLGIFEIARYLKSVPRFS